MVNKKEMILSLMKETISISDFYVLYEKSFGKLDICYELEAGLKAKDSEAIDLFLYLGALLHYEYKCISVLNRLIIEKWHEKHEDLARLLGDFKSETSVDFLFEAAQTNFDYLDYDDDYVFADKCIRAIAKINTHESVIRLKQLSLSDNVKIRESANKHLDRIS